MGHGKIHLGSKMRKSLIDFIQFIFPLVILASAWELSVRCGFFSADILPPPSVLIAKCWDLAADRHILIHHTVSSLYRLFFGYCLAVVIGVALGALLALNRVVREMFSPVLSLLISVPTIAWIPVLLVTLGLGERTVITAIFLGGVFEIIYSTIAGIRAVNIQQVNAARIMGVDGIALFFRVLFPASLAAILPALRLSMGYCWRALVGGEMLSAMIVWGLGKMIYEARFWNDVQVMILGLLIIGIIGVILDRVLLKRLEQQTVEKWGMLTES